MLELILALTLVQEPRIITCTVRDSKTTATLTCREHGKPLRLVIPRTAYRFIGCNRVNLQREGGKLTFAPEQTCHIIDTQQMIEACEQWQASQQSYDNARNFGNTPYLPDCAHWWTRVEGKQALVNVYQMRPLEVRGSKGW